MSRAAPDDIADARAALAALRRKRAEALRQLHKAQDACLEAAMAVAGAELRLKQLREQR